MSIANYSFLATDIDPKSLEIAKKNVNLNQWDSKIELRLADPEKSILIDVLKPEETYLLRESNFRFDFCMCNPPFFEDMDQTGLNEKTVCVATEGELVTEGGEVAFVSKLIRESLKLKEKIRYYTNIIIYLGGILLYLAEKLV